MHYIKAYEKSIERYLINNPKVTVISHGLIQIVDQYGNPWIDSLKDIFSINNQFLLRQPLLGFEQKQGTAIGVDAVNTSVAVGTGTNYIAKGAYNLFGNEYRNEQYFLNAYREGSDLLLESAIPQVNYKMNPLNQGGMAPKITDITTPGKSFEFSVPWIEWLEEYRGNTKILLSIYLKIRDIGLMKMVGVL